VEVIHGRLRSKTKAKIAKNAIGCVEGVGEDSKSRVVKVNAVVADKTKDISSSFSPDILEAVKSDPQPHEAKVDLVGGAKKLQFLNEGGGKQLQVSSALHWQTTVTCELMFRCCLALRKPLNVVGCSWLRSDTCLVT
jgi:hypothetical protein